MLRVKTIKPLKSTWCRNDEAAKYAYWYHIFGGLHWNYVILNEQNG